MVFNLLSLVSLDVPGTSFAWPHFYMILKVSVGSVLVCLFSIFHFILLNFQCKVPPMNLAVIQASGKFVEVNVLKYRATYSVRIKIPLVDNVALLIWWYLHFVFLFNAYFFWYLIIGSLFSFCTLNIFSNCLCPYPHLPMSLMWSQVLIFLFVPPMRWIIIHLLHSNFSLSGFQKIN